MKEYVGGATIILKFWGEGEDEESALYNALENMDYEIMGASTNVISETPIED